MEPISWIALEAVKKRLESIKIANGFHTDVKWVSLEAFDISCPDRETPTLHVTTGDMLPEADNLVRGQAGLISPEISIESYAKPSPNAQRDAHRLMYDIIKALPRRGSDLAPDLDKPLEFTSRQILQQPEGIPYVVTQVQFRMAAVERY